MNNIKYRIDKATKALNILSQAEKELNLAKALEVKKKMLLKKANNPKKIIELKQAIKKAEYETELKKKALIKIAIKALKIHGGATEIKNEDIFSSEKISKEKTIQEKLKLLSEEEKKELQSNLQKIIENADKEIKNLEDKINEDDEIKQYDINEIFAKIIDNDADKEITNKIIEDADKEIEKLDKEIKQNSNFYDIISKDIYICLYNINQIDNIYESYKLEEIKKIEEEIKKIEEEIKKIEEEIKKIDEEIDEENDEEKKIIGGVFDINNIKILLKDTKKLLKHKFENVSDENFNIVADIVFASQTAYNYSVRINKSRLLTNLIEIISRIDSEITAIQFYLLDKVNSLKKLIDILNIERQQLIQEINFNKIYIYQCDVDKIISTNNPTNHTLLWIFKNSKSALEMSNYKLEETKLSIKLKEKELIKLKLDVAKMNRIIIELSSAKTNLEEQRRIYER